MPGLLRDLDRPWFPLVIAALLAIILFTPSGYAQGFYAETHVELEVGPIDQALIVRHVMEIEIDEAWSLWATTEGKRNLPFFDQPTRFSLSLGVDHRLKPEAFFSIVSLSAHGIGENDTRFYLQFVKPW